MTDIERAKTIFQTGKYTCVLTKGETVYASTKSGISPMIGFIENGFDLNGFSAADKIVGKAAAMLFVLAGVKEVYAAVLSQKAQEVLTKYGVKCTCDTLAEAIINRAGDDLCPMEKAVADIEEPRAAFEAIKRTLDILRTKNAEDTK